MGPMSKQFHLWVSLGCSPFSGVLFLLLDFLKPAGLLCWMHKDSNWEEERRMDNLHPNPVNSKKCWLVQWAGCCYPIAIFLLLMALGKQACLGIPWKKKEEILLLSPFFQGSLEEWEGVVAAAHCPSCISFLEMLEHMLCHKYSLFFNEAPNPAGSKREYRKPGLKHPSSNARAN